METESMYLIKKSELRKLCTTQSEDEKTSIVFDVIARPYIEKTSGQVLASGLGKGARTIGTGLVNVAGAAIDMIDKASEPPKKKRG